MTLALSLIGVAIVLLLGTAGLLSGELKRVQGDPEVKEEIERRKKELKRQQDWKDKFKS